MHATLHSELYGIQAYWEIDVVESDPTFHSYGYL